MGYQMGQQIVGLGLGLMVKIYIIIIIIIIIIIFKEKKKAVRNLQPFFHFFLLFSVC